MITLILNGSPHKAGDTAALLTEMKKHLTGEVVEFSAYHDDISPCVDCRYCWQNEGCTIQDGMQEIYRAVQDADNLVIASPLYYSQLTGPLISLASRFQCWYAARRFRGIRPVIQRKKGVLILVGGGDGGPEPAQAMVGMLFKHLNSEFIGSVFSLKTDMLPARQDEEAMAKVMELAKELSKPLNT